MTLREESCVNLFFCVWVSYTLLPLSVRKARMHATELARERDALTAQAEKSTIRGCKEQNEKSTLCDSPLPRRNRLSNNDLRKKAIKPRNGQNINWIHVWKSSQSENPNLHVCNVFVHLSYCRLRWSVVWPPYTFTACPIIHCHRLWRAGPLLLYHHGHFSSFRVTICCFDTRYPVLSPSFYMISYTSLVSIPQHRGLHMHIL